MKNTFCLIVMLAAIACAVSCARKEAQLTRVTVTGEADTQAPPDTAVIVLSVVTQSKRAFEAQQQNARKTEAVIAAVKAVAGANAEVKTSSYNLQPERNYDSSRMPTIIGYEARNTVTLTTGELNNTGAIVDAASQAGANSIESVSFTLREGDASRSTSLAEATRQAMSKAEGIARALNGRVVRVVEQREGGAINSSQMDDYDVRARAGTAAKMSAPAQMEAYVTPVQAGSLNLRSQVLLVVEIEARP